MVIRPVNVGKKLQPGSWVFVAWMLNVPPNWAKGLEPGGGEGGGAPGVAVGPTSVGSFVGTTVGVEGELQWAISPRATASPRYESEVLSSSRFMPGPSPDMRSMERRRQVRATLAPGRRGRQAGPGPGDSGGRPASAPPR